MPTKHPQPNDAEYALLSKLNYGAHCYLTADSNWRVSSQLPWMDSSKVAASTVDTCRRQKWIGFVRTPKGRWWKLKAAGRRAYNRK